MNRQPLLYVALLLCSLPFADAQDWYVATSGNDNNPGTQDAPFLTIGHAIGRAAGNDTVIVHGGIYDQGNSALTIDREGLVLRAFDENRPVIRANLGGPFATVYFEEDNCDGSRIDGFEIEGGRHGIQVGSGWPQEDNPDPSPTDELTCDDIVIHNNIVHDVANEGIKLPAGVRNITITNNRIYNTGMPSLSNAECIDAVGVIGLYVAGNHLHHCASNGVYAKGGSVNAIIENNYITDVGRVTNSGAGIYLGFTTTDYQLFDLENNPERFENINSIARNNIVMRARGAGIGVQSALNAKVYNNTLIDVARDTQAGIRLGQGQLCTTLPTDCREELIDFTQTNVAPRIFNNIVVVSQDRAVMGVDDDGVDTDSDFAFNNNRYHHIDTTPTFRWLGDSVSTLTDWQVATTQDAQSAQGNPGLAGDGVHLASNSPLINAGLHIECIGRDYDGNVRGDGSHDIGADEYGSGDALAVPPPTGVVGIGLQLPLPVEEDDCLEDGDGNTGDDGNEDGAVLYAQNCASCHGALSSSTRRGRSAVQIAAAISFVAEMNSLSFLTSSEIDAIAAVLANGTGGGGGGGDGDGDGDGDGTPNGPAGSGGGGVIFWLAFALGALRGAGRRT